MRADDPNRHLKASSGTAMDSARIRNQYLSGKLSTSNYERLVQSGPGQRRRQRRPALVPSSNIGIGSGRARRLRSCGAAGLTSGRKAHAAARAKRRTLRTGHDDELHDPPAIAPDLPEAPRRPPTWPSCGARGDAGRVSPALVTEELCGASGPLGSTDQWN